jgi:DNA-binding MarR family transcriptional regulator
MRPLTHRLYLLGQMLGSSAEKLLRSELGIGFTDYLTLHGLESRRRCSQAEIADFAGVTEAGMSRIVSRLTAKGLIAAETDLSNRRRTLLSLTAKGQELAGKAEALLEERFASVAAQAAKAGDLEAFGRVLDAILAIMERK